MKIIVVGAGKVGFSIAKILSEEGHDITVIDKNPDTINRLSNNLDVICVEGIATSVETLTEAGAQKADLLVAATRSDEINMVCGISAKKLGTKNIVARVRDTAYLRQTEFLREALGLSTIVNPEYECAKEISRILRFPSANRVDAFSKGSLEIVEHRVMSGGRLEGRRLKELPGTFGAKVLVSVVERNGDAEIPNGDFMLQAGDVMSISGTNNELRKFFVATGRYKKPVRNVMIIGGGRVAIYLARMLIEYGMSVSIIEKDPSRCDELCDLAPSARIICGDATRSDVLLEEGILSTDAFVALTGDDGDNVVTSLYAKRCEVRKIVVKVNREYYGDILDGAGIDSVVNPKTLVSQQLAKYVRAMENSAGSSMETLYRIADGKVEAVEFQVKEGSKCIGIPLKTLKIKKNVLICAIIRGSKTIIPDGETIIKAEDHAVIVAKAGWLKTLDAILES